MKHTLKKWSTAAMLSLVCGMPLTSWAAWPDDQTIELVVGFAPGGGTDLMARALVPFVEKKLGGKARIVVVNKPGAGGEISSTYIARAKPDGYTIGFINVPGFVFIPMYKQSTYQTDDLKIIARVVDDPAVLVARKNSKYKTLPDILEALKKDPGSLSFATSGRGTSGHQALLKIEQGKACSLAKRLIENIKESGVLISSDKFTSNSSVKLEEIFGELGRYVEAV